MKRLFTLLTAGAIGLGLGADLTVSAATLNGQDAFASECSACHMAYQPFFLPTRSWKTIMGDLSNHFGEDASLDDASRVAIQKYLVGNAADANGRMPNWLRAIPANQTPLRITNLPWYQSIHGARVVNWVKRHPEIGTVSNCTGCHRGAARGSFGDD